MKTYAKALTAIAFVVLGMGGLYLNIPHSGWILACGCLVTLGVVND